MKREMAWIAGLSLVLLTTLASASEPFVRGDVTGDGRVGFGDVVAIFRAVAERRALPCPDAADFTDNGLVHPGDAGLLFESVLKGGPPPRAPYPEAGEDPTEDALGCGERGPPAEPLTDEALYSFTVLPPVGGVPGFRLRVYLEASVGVFGGRLVLGLPEAWASDGLVVDVRPSLELTSAMTEDGVVAARIGVDRKLRCVWMVSRSDFGAVLVPEGRVALCDLSVCWGETPEGSYELVGETGEVVTVEGEDLVTTVEGGKTVEVTGPVTCPVEVESTHSMRVYLWMTDARAEPGETFRVSLWSATGFDSRHLAFGFRWNPVHLRAVWADWVRREGYIGGFLRNYDRGTDLEGPTRNYTLFTQDPALSPIGFYICLPCWIASAEGRPSFGQYPIGVGAPRFPYPADTEFHHMNVIFQVLPGAAPGQVRIEFIPYNPAQVVPNNADAFRAVQAVDEVNWPAFPLLAARVEILPSSGRRMFLRGDADGDGDLLITDAIATLGSLFSGSPGLDCLDAADTNDDGRLDLSDAVYGLSFLFLGGMLIPPPYPLPGTDWSEDTLGCGE